MSTARNATAVSPHDTTALDPEPDALYVGTGGAITFRAKGSGADVETTVPDGGYILCQVSHVRDTGTDASGILGLFL